MEVAPRHARPPRPRAAFGLPWPLADLACCTPPPHRTPCTAHDCSLPPHPLPRVCSLAISTAIDDLRFEQLGAPGRLPFNISRFPSVIHAKAKAVPAWASSKSAADEPPPSPLDASRLGDATDVLLVPYGASNLRMAGLPWY